MTSKPLIFMNESVLLEALKEIKSATNLSFREYFWYCQKKSVEAIKKWEDSSGKETGMKWVKASERLPKDHWQGKFRNINDNSLKEYKGIHELSKGRFSTGGLIIQSRNVEWLDESVPPYKEEVDKTISAQTRSPE